MRDEGRKKEGQPRGLTRVDAHGPGQTREHGGGGAKKKHTQHSFAKCREGVSAQTRRKTPLRLKSVHSFAPKESVAPPLRS